MLLENNGWKSNGRYRVLNDEMFEELAEMYSLASVDLREFLRDRLFKHNEYDLSPKNQKRLEEIKKDYTKSDLTNFVQAELERLSSLSLSQATTYDMEKLEIYKTMNEFLESENKYWLIWNICHTLNSHHSRAIKSYVTLRVYNQLYNKFNLGQFIELQYAEHIGGKTVV